MTDEWHHCKESNSSTEILFLNHEKSGLESNDALSLGNCAGEAEPNLEGLFVCCYLNEKGEVIAAEPRPRSKVEINNEEEENSDLSNGPISVPSTPKNPPNSEGKRRRSG